MTVMNFADLYGLQNMASGENLVLALALYTFYVGNTGSYVRLFQKQESWHS